MRASLVDLFHFLFPSPNDVSTAFFLPVALKDPVWWPQGILSMVGSVGPSEGLYLVVLDCMKSTILMSEEFKLDPAVVTSVLL